MPRFILLDIEGTTTDIEFVHKVLFPYSAERLPDYVSAHATDPEVRAILDQVKQTVQSETAENIDDAQAVERLLLWIREDRKHGSLKKLQGLIWKSGFENGDYQGHVYADVPPILRQWKDQGIQLGIYSSGSVQAQQLLFRYSVAGDLTPLFTRYFDTAVGGKKEPDSYAKIAAELKLEPGDILFLSDVEEELDAAAQAGMQVMHSLRGGQAAGKYPAFNSFEEISLEEAGMVC